MTDEPTLAELGARRAELRAELKELMPKIEAKILAEVVPGGKSERLAATEAQVDRMWVRKLLGKRE